MSRNSRSPFYFDQMTRASDRSVAPQNRIRISEASAAIHSVQRRQFCEQLRKSIHISEATREMSQRIANIHVFRNCSRIAAVARYE